MHVNLKYYFKFFQNLNLDTLIRVLLNEMYSHLYKLNPFIE